MHGNACMRCRPCLLPFDRRVCVCAEYACYGGLRFVDVRVVPAASVGSGTLKVFQVDAGEPVQQLEVPLKSDTEVPTVALGR